jgi:hypothetical protein
MTINCWPNGTNTRQPGCDATIPDSRYRTMRRFGWGFVQAVDAGSPSGDGPFYACPDHRDDCTEEEREAARKRNALARSAAPTKGE